MKVRILYILLISWLFLAAAPIISDKATSNKDFVAGKAYYKKQDYTNARFYLLRAVREEPSNEQALLMLANLEERTKHYATAIVHLNDLLALNPYNEHFWRKKIGLYRLQGNDVEADRLLERLCTIYPEDENLQRLLHNRKMERFEATYKQQRESGDVEGQISSVRSAITLGQQQGDKSKAELANLALNLANLLANQGRTGEALDALSMGLNFTPGNMALIRKKAGILAEQGRTMEAYTFLKNLPASSRGGEVAAMLRDLEETLLAQSQLSDPYTMNGRNWEAKRDTAALHYLINTSITRGYLDDAQVYLEEARQLYGETPQLLYRMYMVEKRLGNEGKSIQLLHKIHAVQPQNEEVTDILAKYTLRDAAEYIEDMRYPEAIVLLDSVIAMRPDADIVISAKQKRKICDEYYLDKDEKAKAEYWDKQVPALLAEGSYEEAIVMADSALAYNPKHEMMNYYKGMAYEHMHEWDKAYAAFKLYQPSPIEVPDHRRHLNSLLSRRFRNGITVDYQQARLGSEDRLTANASVTYDRKLKNDDNLTAAITYSARDYSAGEDDSYYDDNGNLITKPGTAPILDNGGVGIQVKGEYEHKFSEKFSAKAGIGGANRYFPLLSINAAATWNIRKEWSVGPHIGYRLSDTSHNFGDKILSGTKKVSILNVGGDVGKDFGQFHYSGGADLFLIKGNVYVNAKSKMQYFPLEKSRTHVFAAVGMGTAPELEIVDNSLPTGFSRLNSFVSGGGFYSFNSHFGLAANGTWFNLVNTQGYHKNYFYINAQFQILF